MGSGCLGSRWTCAHKLSSHTHTHLNPNLNPNTKRALRSALWVLYLYSLYIAYRPCLALEIPQPADRRPQINTESRKQKAECAPVWHIRRAVQPIESPPASRLSQVVDLSQRCSLDHVRGKPRAGSAFFWGRAALPGRVSPSPKKRTRFGGGRARGFLGARCAAWRPPPKKKNPDKRLR
jgi:hypothetical protein